LRCLAGPLNPVNVFASALFKKDGDTVARIANAPAELLQFGFQKFVVGAFGDFGDTRLQPGQASSNRVGNNLRRANTKFAALSKIAG
jgi:hypothetical protein